MLDFEMRCRGTDMNVIKYVIFISVIAVLAVVAGCSTQKQANNGSNNAVSNAEVNSNGGNMPMNDRGMGPSRMQTSAGAADAPYDLQFLDTMVAHHRAAIDMATAIEGRAQHPELNTLAQNILDSQQKEFVQMKRWRLDWFGGYSPAVNMAMLGMNDSMKDMDMKKLGSLTGNDLDLEFIKEMIPHHQGAVAMANEALQKSQKNEIKMLANGIIKTQNAEIRQMQDWQKAWTK